MEDDDDDSGIDLTTSSDQESSSSKRQKTHASAPVQPAAPKAVGRRSSRSAAATATPLAPELLLAASGPATQPMRGLPRSPTGAPVAGAPAGAPAAAALSASSVAEVARASDSSVSTMLLQALQTSQAAYLEAQARSEERAATSERLNRESTMEMMRLSQSGQQTIVQLVCLPGNNFRAERRTHRTGTALC